MRSETTLILLLIVQLLFSSCKNELRCERHYLPNGFTGKVTVYYSQQKGLKDTDEEGCSIFNVSANGESFSGFPFKKGTSIPNKTIRYFETIGYDSMLEMKEFIKPAYLNDTSSQKESMKYVFYLSSGYQNPDGNSPNYTTEYAVDYGRNYHKYQP